MGVVKRIHAAKQEAPNVGVVKEWVGFEGGGGTGVGAGAGWGGNWERALLWSDFKCVVVLMRRLLADLSAPGVYPFCAGLLIMWLGLPGWLVQWMCFCDLFAKFHVLMDCGAGPHDVWVGAFALIVDALIG